MEFENCEAAHQDFINMVDSGKTIEELEADLQQCSSGAMQLGNIDASPADFEMACNGVCNVWLCPHFNGLRPISLRFKKCIGTMCGSSGIIPFKHFLNDCE